MSYPAPQPTVSHRSSDEPFVERRSRASRMERLLNDLLSTTPEIEAATVVSYDGLPMASALPRDLDEDRVAAMSAALLSLGERATQGLGRGGLSQIYVEGEYGTVFLVSAEEAVLVAIASAGAKVGMLRYEVRHAAARLASALKALEPQREAVPTFPSEAPRAVAGEQVPEPIFEPVVEPVAEPSDEAPFAAPAMPYTMETPLEPSGWLSYSPPDVDLPPQPPWP